MPATVLSFTCLRSRRWFLALCAASLHAQDDESTLKLLTQLASRLSDGNLPGALSLFSKDMPGYQDLTANLGAVTAQYDIICVIEIREESGTAERRKAETEWFLQLRSRQEHGPTERRTVTVRITTERVRGHWQVTAMEPLSVLAPPEIR